MSVQEIVFLDLTGMTQTELAKRSAFLTMTT